MKRHDYTDKSILTQKKDKEVIGNLSKKEINYFRELAHLQGFVFHKYDTIDMFMSKIEKSVPNTDLREQSKNAIGF